MRSVRADSSDSVGGGDSAPIYRVRIWTPPPAPHFAWYVDEWDVTEAEQVTDVIEWGAKNADGHPFEVFLRWEDHHFTRDGRPEAILPLRADLRPAGRESDRNRDCLLGVELDKSRTPTITTRQQHTAGILRWRTPTHCMTGGRRCAGRSPFPVGAEFTTIEGQAPCT